MSVDETIPQPESARTAVKWIDAAINRSLEEIDDNFSKYRISDALMQTYKLFWDDFSGWYLEIIKPEYGKPLDIKTYKATLQIFESLMKIIHPFMPFISEEIWQRIEERSDGKSIMIEKMPVSKVYDSEMLRRFELAQEIVSAVRTIRKEKNISYKDKLVLCCSKGATGVEFDAVIMKMCNLAEIRSEEGKVAGALSFRIHTSEFFVPLEGSLDNEEEIKKLEEELKYTQGFLASVMAKLSNGKFVSNAPEKVIALERKKQEDAEAKINTLKESISLFRQK